MTERLLMGPGPSNAAPEVLEALSRPMLGFLTPEFLETLDGVADGLRRIFQTSNRMTFAVSGTGSAGLEAALVNILEPGDELLVGVNGLFGGRLADVASRAGAEPVRIEAQWGRPIEPSDVRAALESHPRAKAVAIVHAETTTGVAQPIEEIAALVRDHGALFVLDVVTSLAGTPVDVDAWGVDVAYSGTQKCLSVPPGLAPITFSERALEAVRARRTPVQSWYLDVTLLEGYWGTDRVYHHTAPISMLQGLHAGIGLVLDEGLEARWERHARNGAVLEEALVTRGFSYVAPEGMRLPQLHCVRPPANADEAALRQQLFLDHGIELGAGVGPFKGECWRVGLMGHTSRAENVERFVAALDAIL
jgi:alanine-glyoxylate transaminase/serine-glyoxylate transaminase/serine-pyruvate transaminase